MTIFFTRPSAAPAEADLAYDSRPGSFAAQMPSGLVLPCALLVAGAAIGYVFTLDARVAAERLVGLVLASAIAITAVTALRHVERPAPLLATAAAMALLGGLWVIAASGPDVFRGSVGAILQPVFRPIFGLAQVTDPIEVANTRFIVGYNGLADLSLVSIFSCGALLLERTASRTSASTSNRNSNSGSRISRWVRQPAARWALLAAIGVSLLLLIGAGGRGGLTGLVAGLCAIGVFAWPRRHLVPALFPAPAALLVAAVAILDKGLEFSSTAGRLTYWGDLARLLVEYPLTGTGLGVDTAYRVSIQYQINPDPERVFYAHNTLVQSYLELGPLGAIGMLLVPLAAVTAAVVARRCGVAAGRRPLLTAGLGIVGGLTAHGLTDQVVTTNVGTCLVLLGLAAVLAALTPRSLAALGSLARATALILVTISGLTLLAFAAVPSGRAQVLLDFGGLQLNRALALDPQSPGRAGQLDQAEATLSLALAQDAGHPAVLRELAWARSARFDDSHALEALEQAAASPRIDAFDMLQIAQLYRDLGFAQEAYGWASRAYTTWGRPAEGGAMPAYARATLAVMDDFRARTLADQAEAAMRARRFGEARALFQEALTFQPESVYLLDRLGAAQRAVDKYGAG